jgi:acyl-CoA oxidase
MALAAQGASGKVAASAASAAFDDNLDLVVELGWANVEAHCGRVFAQRIATAPPQLRHGLSALHLTYLAARTEKSAAHHLASGTLNGGDVDATRGFVNDMCRALGRGGKSAAAIRLAEGWGIPDHLLQAPIAFDWRKIGA